jgi:nitrogenase-associated protein
MKIILFYEKPGCVTNTKQKAMLRRAGCMVIERNLLDHGMNQDELLAFLKPLHVSQWFNPNAPKIKDGTINPNRISEAAAIKLLMLEPLLIRRPLIVALGRKLCGFDANKLESILQVRFESYSSEACSSPDSACQ